MKYKDKLFAVWLLVIVPIVGANELSTGPVDLNMPSFSIKLEKENVFQLNEEEVFSKQFVTYFVSFIAPQIVDKLAGFWVPDFLSQGVLSIENYHECIAKAVRAFFTIPEVISGIYPLVDLLINNLFIELVKLVTACQAVSYIEGETNSVYDECKLPVDCQIDEVVKDWDHEKLVELIVQRLVRDVLNNLPSEIEKRLLKLSET